MVDTRNFYSKNALFLEMTQPEKEIWFDFSRQKVLHNIDTFYYTVKLKEDLSKTSSSDTVQAYRDYFKPRLETIRETREPMFLNLLPDLPDLLLMPGGYGKYYKVHLQYADIFDIFMALEVPPSQDKQASVTPEIIVQLRSYNLWLYGVHGAFDSSYFKLQKILTYFELHIKVCQENRCDFCFHSNYLDNPEKFFDLENFYKMRCDHFKGTFTQSDRVGTDGYEFDYHALGKRGDKCFVRIDLKTKEVVQKGYKAFFFLVWKLYGLINEYDKWCLERAYQFRDWHYLDLARLEFYLEHGQSETAKNTCRILIKEYNENHRLTDDMIELANYLTPPIHKIINVEFQVMRKMSKSFQLLSKDGVPHEVMDVEQYLYNLPLIKDYLTGHVLRLVNPDNDGDSNKARREDTPFWAKIRKSKPLYDLFDTEEQELLRKYQRNLNADLMKKQILQKSVVYGFYQKGRNTDDPLEDAMQALLTFNDNDIWYARMYKTKKAAIFPSNEYDSSLLNEHLRNITVIDNDGVVYDQDTIKDIVCQYPASDFSDSEDIF